MECPTCHYFNPMPNLIKQLLGYEIDFRCHRCKAHWQGVMVDTSVVPQGELRVLERRVLRSVSP